MNSRYTLNIPQLYAIVSVINEVYLNLTANKEFKVCLVFVTVKFQKKKKKEKVSECCMGGNTDKSIEESRLPQF